MRFLIICISILSIIQLPIIGKGQAICDTIPFINCNANKIIYSENDSNFIQVIQKLKQLKTNTNQSVQIVHIGDSHLQAGFLTEKIKQLLFQDLTSDSFAGPGFIFPYKIAETNNPFYFKVSSTGNWEWCKNIDQEKTCSLGLSGITILTKDTLAAIRIKMQNEKYNNPAKYYFNRIKLLHKSSNKVNITINNVNSENYEGYSIVDFSSSTDSLFIEINQKTDNQFELYGIILENTKSQINYHTIGVNGAMAQSYLKCDYFSDHLKLIHPDLVIISLGTNEAYDEDFSQLKHEFELKDLIYQIQDIAPNSAILLINANDHLKKREFTNPNIQEVNNNIAKVSRELNLSLWDFYSIMGGENSINKWYEKGLSGEDKLHFKKLGYEIQGELFEKALMNLIEEEL